MPVRGTAHARILYIEDNEVNVRLVERAMPFVLGFAAIVATGVLVAALAGEFLGQ